MPLYRVRLPRPLVVALVALIPRLAYVAMVSAGVRIEPGSDAVSYDAFARAMLSGWSWVTAPQVREPLYPLLMAVAYRLPGPEIVNLLILQALIGAAAAVVVYLGLRSLVRESVAFLAGLLVALNPHFVAFAGEVYRENLVVMLLACCVVATLHLGRAPSLRRAFHAALFLVLLIHTDARFLPFIAVLPLMVLAMNRSLRTTVNATVPLVLFFVVLMVPYQVRTLPTTGKPTLVTSRTFDLWVPLLARRFAGGPGVASTSNPRLEWLQAWEVKKQAALDSLTVDERELFRSGARPEIRKWRTYGVLFVEYWRFARFGSMYLPYPDGRYSGLWSRRHNVSSTLAVLPFLLLLPFAVFRSSGEEKRVFVAIMIFLVAHTVLHVFVHALERYRIPVEVLTSMVLAMSVVNLWGWAHRK